tara:strand:+ start:198 stop:350 length:153 start_codon:yes stop_codon:yes gene_type:complete
MKGGTNHLDGETKKKTLWDREREGEREKGKEKRNRRRLAWERRTQHSALG